MEEIENYAIENYVPIMEKESLNYLLDFIKKNKILTILELGSAIGYSTINMALVNKNIKIISIERNINRYEQALINIKKFNLENQITIINDDIFNIDLDKKFDLIFIDAAKAQNIKFFNKFKTNLNSNGFIVTDNIKFHGLTSNIETIKNKRVRQLVSKISNYIEFLKNNEEFKTIFVDVGDGLSISSKNKLWKNM